jgi:hypothetical protein
MGLKAFTEGSKKTLHQQIVLLATSLANPEVRKVCLWAIHMIVSHCPVSRYTHARITPGRVHRPRRFLNSPLLSLRAAWAT